ncbi:phage tail fiber protein [Pseudomonas rubra]|uniref:Phage tail fiber protein n=1 Tax=Pseudomonas rubra TaxID=2942627 RepID=A0ABT5P6C8_9PSED|nr:phage tail fiber protein [Pseudomonas rubra]MDD1013845.1 phage tail fiber protein [Pseudomonas rubra]MDD1038334.1 phage tail fiber protein [Pseudomonas rubra]MDD1154576.1 phage tail fiber protein [Pseudomonas rubra]
MAAPKTVLTYPLNGALKDFPIPFEYLARKFVVVTLLGSARRPLVLNSEYRFTTKTTITTTSAWGTAQGFDSIEIRRVTSATERLVDFSDGSILRAYDLNTSQVQSLHIAEEARDLTADTIGVNNDGNLDARSRRIVNLADAVNPGDAVTLRQNQQWAGSALNQANLSAQSAAASEASRQASTSQATNSANSALASQTSRLASEAARDLAQNYRDASLANAQNAAGSNSYAALARDSAIAARDGATAQADRARTEADRATTQADRAKTEADKLGNMNDIAANLDSTSTGAGNWSVVFKGLVRAVGAIFAKRFEALPYTEAAGYGQQWGTGAPFLMNEGTLTATSAYYPILKGKFGNSGVGEAVSFGVLSRTDGLHSAVIHWGNSGGGYSPLLAITKDGSSAQFSGTISTGASGGVYSGTGGIYDAGNRVWSAGNFNPALKLQGTGVTNTMGNQNSVCGVQYLNLSAGNQVYNGAFEVRENGLVGNGGPAPGHIYNAPSIAFHWGATVVNKLMMSAGGNLCWGNPAGEFSQLGTNGIVFGSAYGAAGTLSGWVDANFTSKAAFASQAVASINAGTLGNVAFLYNQSGAAQGNNAVLGGGSLQWSSHNAVGGIVGGGSWRCNGWSNNGGCATWQRIA